MGRVTALFLGLPSGPRVPQKLLFRNRLLCFPRQLRDHLGVICQSCQVAFRQPAALLPFLDGRRPIPEPSCDRREANKSNRACHGTHYRESVHRKWKLSRDPKCKHRGADCEGAGRHPNNDVLGETARGQQRCWTRMRPFRYRARARCLAQRCAEMAGRRRITSSEKSDHAGRQSWCQHRMAEDWARAEIR